tara:strand:- start:853 stop:1296 length:444 start_codon:yes stop_codon:yes gene_type:complete
MKQKIIINLILIFLLFTLIKIKNQDFFSNGRNILVLQKNVEGSYGSSWTMSSDSHPEIIGKEEKWQTLTFKSGDVVTFQGETTSSHWFGIKNLDNNEQVIGNLPSNSLESGSKFKYVWNVPNKGNYEYICPPHQNGMKGEIIITKLS